MKMNITKFQYLSADKLTLPVPLYKILCHSHQDKVLGHNKIEHIIASLIKYRVKQAGKSWFD